MTRSVKRKSLSARKPVPNLVKKALSTTGLSVKAPKVRRVVGLTVILLMVKAVINLVADPRARSAKNILLVGQHPALAKSVVKARVGERKPKSEARRNEGQNQT